MASEPKPLQLAQMLADIQSLELADKEAALSLVSANVASLEPAKSVRSPAPPSRPSLHPSSTSASSLARMASSQVKEETSVERANALMALSEMRANIRNQDHTSLLRAREMVDSLTKHITKEEAGPQAQERVRSTSGLFMFPR